jgi:hypothetical protein
MSEGSADDGAVDAGGHKHAALFAHVGVSDPTDWRAVALRLANRYAPELLGGVHTRTPVSGGKKVGRPKKWTDLQNSKLLLYVELVREASRDGLIRSDLVTITAICRFIVGSSPDSEWIRTALELEPGTNPATLENRYRLAVKLQYGVAANENRG